MFLDLPTRINGTERLGLRTKKGGTHKQRAKSQKGLVMYQFVAACVRLMSLTIVNFSNSERVDMVMVYGVAARTFTSVVHKL